jgi:hypothetical protein
MKSGNLVSREGKHMLRINALSVLYVVLCLSIPGVAVGGDADAGAAESAVVLEEGLTVYPRPQEAGAAVKHLKKGDTVFTNLEIMGSDGETWCTIVSDADMAVTGYVKCDGLQMSKPRTRELWRELPEPSPPVERARGVPSLPPAALPPPQSGKSPMPPAR